MGADESLGTFKSITSLVPTSTTSTPLYSYGVDVNIMYLEMILTRGATSEIPLQCHFEVFSLRWLFFFSFSHTIARRIMIDDCTVESSEKHSSHRTIFPCKISLEISRTDWPLSFISLHTYV